jgi:hypothetical protein
VFAVRSKNKLPQLQPTALFCAVVYARVHFVSYLFACVPESLTQQDHDPLQLYKDSDLFVEVSSLKATFADGESVVDFPVINATLSPLGKVLVLQNHHFQLQLIFQTPIQDWRLNQTYRYKLTSVSLSGGLALPTLYWNVGGYVNSQIQVD